MGVGLRSDNEATRVHLESAVALGDQIRQAAQEIAKDIRTRLSDAGHRLMEERLLKFPVQQGSDHLCPRCWIEKGGLSPLKKISNQGDHDIFRCGVCEYELLVPHV
jgi:hypothetical protein